MSEDAPAPAWPCPQLATSILWASHRQRSTRPTHSHCSGGQTEMNNKIIEMNILQEINSRITEAEERIRDLEDRMEIGRAHV